MKCFVRHTGQNFERCFGPFDTMQEAWEWMTRPSVHKAGVRGAIVPLVPGSTPELELWNLDEWEKARAGG